jgi:A/G-specific adenine glycosylase
MSENTTFFRKKLITWYLQNKRDLPWRGVKDPYLIWLSEIMLQQTRVAQGLPYYKKFVKAYPTVQLLANAPEEEVLKLWQGLGYYSRARNLLFTAKYVANELNGEFPNTYENLKKLKGIGDYTASAMASICFNAPTAVVDGNVYRVLSRVFGIATPINSTEGIRQFKKLAQELIEVSQPGTYNQAVMEFGARYCVPQNPLCTACIFNDRCEALKSQKVQQLPVKLKKLKVKKRYFNYLAVVSDDGKVLLQQRKGKGIWQHLYEFPLVESKAEISENDLKKSDEYLSITKGFTISSVSKYNEEVIIHKLSHQHLHTVFWIVTVKELGPNAIPISEINNYPVPVLINTFIEKATLFKKEYLIS